MDNINLLTLFMGVMTAVALGGIPWAYKINGRLTSIETALKYGLQPPAWLSDKVDDNAKAINKLRRDLDKVGQENA